MNLSSLENIWELENESIIIGQHLELENEFDNTWELELEIESAAVGRTWELEIESAVVG